MPLFVRAGSIVPTGPAIQYTGNNSHVAAHAQCLHRRQTAASRFTRTTASAANISTANIRAFRSRGTSERKRSTIGAREGNGYAGMAGKRTINIRWMKPGNARALTFDAKPDATITYERRRATVRMR